MKDSLMSIHPDPLINTRNVLGERLSSCCFSPITGYYRDGFCHTGIQDFGLHTVCVQVTSEFLSFSLQMGNDLITPLPQFEFQGLVPGDFWCLCVTRWKEALDAGVAPKVKLEACHEAALAIVTLEELMEYAI
jgi:uncharacterized protein (DUF2237 family)